jgi:hypothetical protein
VIGCGLLVALRRTGTVFCFFLCAVQCDPRWGNNMMVDLTICDVGCLMSSTSMALAQKNISITGAAADPGTFNSWLRTHNGYDSGNGLIEANVPPLNPAHIQVGGC